MRYFLRSRHVFGTKLNFRRDDRHTRFGKGELDPRTLWAKDSLKRVNELAENRFGFVVFRSKSGVYKQLRKLSKTIRVSFAHDLDDPIADERQYVSFPNADVLALR